jgi:hypothetical protein
MQQYDAQSHRGKEGFGIYDGKHGYMVHAAQEKRILNWLCKYDSPLLLMHHRFPTSTINVKKAAHPFSTKDYFGDTQYILVHNGSIRNAQELHDAHNKLGIEYYSELGALDNDRFNDSEALLWDFALYMQGTQKKLAATGGVAFICLRLTKGKLDRMYFGRNSNPLRMFRDKNGIELSSEGKGDLIDPYVLHTWNYDLHRLTKRALDFAPAVYVQTNYPSYEYTTPYSYAGAPKVQRYPYDDDDDMEYELDEESGIYVPAHTYVPSRKEIEEAARDYLRRAGGFFETALYIIEADFDDCWASGDMNDQALLTAVEYYIQDDPEYVDSESKSSEVVAWNQQKLLTA